MLAWSGFGWIAYFIIGGSLFGMVAVLDGVFGAGYSRQHSVVLAVCAATASSLLCWPVGRYFNRHLPPKVFDGSWARKGRPEGHSTFFVRMEYAGLLVGLPLFLMVACLGLDGMDQLRGRRGR